MPASPEYVCFLSAELCLACKARVCVDTCIGTAITADARGLPRYDREKCIQCGACLWDCPAIDEARQEALISAAVDAR